MLRGPDSSELEIDLANVEQHLRHLDVNDTLSPAERELEKLYFIHWQRRLRRLLRTEDSSFELGKELNEESRAALHQIKPSDESWKVITPRLLLRAVVNIREDVERQFDAQRDYSKDRCFNDLHPLVPGLAEPAIFKNYFYACIARIQQVVTHISAISRNLAQPGRVGRYDIDPVGMTADCRPYRT